MQIIKDAMKNSGQSLRRQLRKRKGNRSVGRSQRGKGVAGPGRSEMRIIIARRSTLNVSNRGRSEAAASEEEGKECAAESLVIKINLALLPLTLQGGARDKTNATDQDIGGYPSVLC